MMLVVYYVILVIFLGLWIFLNFVQGYRLLEFYGVFFEFLDDICVVCDDVSFINFVELLLEIMEFMDVQFVLL